MTEAVAEDGSDAGRHGSEDPPAEEPGVLLARGDAARDARRWPEAASAYAAFLRLHPDDRGILVQHGHCLKESGDPAAALALYRRAEAMDPDEADIHLQVGHALKLLGRRGAAAEAYGRALRLDPAAGATWAEWLGTMDSLPPPRAAGPLLDLSDLVAWYAHRRAPSGIQRVQAEIAAAAGDAVLCAMHPDEGAWRFLPSPLFHRLHHLSRTGADPEAPDWREAVGVLLSLRRKGQALRVGAGATLITLGSAWWLPRHATALRGARAAGARHVPVLHDCGPLTLPEHASPGLRAEFGRWFSALPVLADGVIAVSRATAGEYRELMARHLPEWPAPPAVVVTPDGRAADPPAETEVPLPAGAQPTRALAIGRRRAAAPGAGRPAHPDLPEGPYVLMVSSLEPRKNHLLALRAWRILLDRRGEAGTPRLVLVGRRAEGDGPVLEALAADAALAARVSLLHGVDDGALDRLYRGCLFTLYPSQHEGWGLPVSESLLHRRVPLVSEIPALAESGRRGAVFFTPGSAGDLATVAEGLVADPARLAAAAARIPRHGGLRPWGEVAAELLAAAARLGAAAPPCPLPPLPACRPVRIGHGGVPGPAPALSRAEALLHGSNWHPVEDWGAWTLPGRAVLRLAAPGEGPARVALALRPAPGAQGLLRVSLDREGAAPATAECPAGTTEELAIEVGAGGPALRLALETEEGSALAGERMVGVGVVAVAVMRGASPADRLAYLENRILVPVS